MCTGPTTGAFSGIPPANSTPTEGMTRSSSRSTRKIALADGRTEERERRKIILVSCKRVSNQAAMRQSRACGPETIRYRQSKPNGAGTISCDAEPSISPVSQCGLGLGGFKLLSLFLQKFEDLALGDEYRRDFHTQCLRGV